MSSRTVVGGGGLKLYVEDGGNPGGKPILLIHGLSQCRLAWQKQAHSDLADEFRLVTVDLRGHGLSEKPRGVYGDSRSWAEDVNAVIKTLGLYKPLLTGWSYGGLVISDYVQRYGEDDIAGTHWVGAVSRMGEPLIQPGFLTEDFLGLVPGFFSENVEESVATLERFLRLCLREEPGSAYFDSILGYNAFVPPHVRQGLLSRNLDHDPVLATMRKPALLSYGERDQLLAPSMCRHIAGLLKHAQTTIYPDSGHAPFWEAPERFNRELRHFRNSV